jgi:thiol-disulfide isomerase/thioredoxin
LDTNATSSGKTANTPPALWAALTLLALGAMVVLYVLFAAASKPAAPSNGLARWAKGAMHTLVVRANPPAMPATPIFDAAGHATSLPAMRGDIVVVNLWATWCAPCMEEMPTLGALQRRFDPARVHVVAVDLDEDADRDKAQAELARLTQGSLALYTDSTRAVLFNVDADGMPATIFYKHGREIARLTGGADWSSPEAAVLVDAALRAP